MENKFGKPLHLIVNWKSSPDFTINSIASHSLILKEGSEYVWYGKMVKSEPISINEEYYDSLKFQINNGISTHLYLYSPDYRERVCHVGKVIGIQKEFPEEKNLIPPHYDTVPYPVSYWFKVSDFRMYSYEMLQHLFDVEQQIMFDMVSATKYPIVVQERETIDPPFDYGRTAGVKYFEKQKLYSDIISQKTDPLFVFVIMPFAEQFKDIYKYGIKNAVNSFKNWELRVEKANDTLSNKAIMKKIREKIREASLIIADVTDNNPNVLYELGYATALEKETIIITQNRKEIPFDLNENPNVEYNRGDTSDLKKQLVKHIRAHFEKST